MSDYFRKYVSLFSTTLSSSIGTGTGETITLASATNVPTDTEVTITIDRVDSSGNATPTKMERITGTLSGSNLTSYTRGVDNSTEQAHSSGAVIEMIWNAADWNDSIDGVLVEHNQDGTHKDALVTTLKATGAEINTGTEDAKIVTPKAIADSDIQTGWTSAREDWTYASASTITVPSGAASKYAVGDKIKWTQTTVKYGVITIVADTLLTIAVNTDYTVADAAISANYYSHEANPLGYPQWFNYTPTFGGFSTNPSSPVARFSVVGRICTVVMSMSNAGTSNATGFTVSAPITAATNTNHYNMAWADIIDNGAESFGSLYLVSNSASITLRKTAGVDGSFTNSGAKRAWFILSYEI